MPNSKPRLKHRRRRGWLRNQIKAGLGVQCHYCGCWVRFKKATVDHYVPKSAGGADHPSNWRACCNDCNVKKANMMPEDFQLMMQTVTE